MKKTGSHCNKKIVNSVMQDIVVVKEVIDK